MRVLVYGSIFEKANNVHTNPLSWVPYLKLSLKSDMYPHELNDTKSDLFLPMTLETKVKTYAPNCN